MSIIHWLIVLAVVLVIFGTKRLRNAGRDMGEAVKGFKQGMRDDEPSQPRPPIEHQTRQQGTDASADSAAQGTSDRDRNRNDAP